MPKLTLLLGRRTMQVYDFKQESIIIGRKPATEWDFDTKNLEVIAAHELRGERFGLAVRIHRD